jgi:predicted Holliday junction resolvase-like endonuclease
MSTIELVLLIVLGVGVFILLILAIVIAFIIVKIMQNLRRISSKAEAATDNLSSTLKVVAKRVAPVAATTIIGMVLKKLSNKKTKEDE